MKRVISKHHTREWVDVFYTLVYSEATLLPTYLGHTGTTIHYDEDNQVTQYKMVMVQCTAGDEGPVGVLSSESIFAHFQGLLTSVQLAATK